MSQAAIQQLVDIELNALNKRIASIGYKLVIDNQVKQYLGKRGYDVQFGARPLKRAIQNYVEDELSELIINENLTEGATITASYDSEADKLVFTATKPQA